VRCGTEQTRRGRIVVDLHGDRGGRRHVRGARQSDASGRVEEVGEELVYGFAVDGGLDDLKAADDGRLCCVADTDLVDVAFGEVDVAGEFVAVQRQQEQASPAHARGEVCGQRLLEEELCFVGSSDALPVQSLPDQELAVPPIVIEFACAGDAFVERGPVRRVEVGRDVGKDHPYRLAGKLGVGFGELEGGKAVGPTALSKMRSRISSTRSAIGSRRCSQLSTTNTASRCASDRKINSR
jgi:hypothetical protein